MTEDGVTEDGVMGDGVMGDGVTEDGVMEDGVMEDGVTEDGVMEDARKLGERNWRNAARDRDSWQKLLKKALAQKGAVVPMMMMMMKINWLVVIMEIESFLRDPNWPSSVIHCNLNY